MDPKILLSGLLVVIGIIIIGVCIEEPNCRSEPEPNISETQAPFIDTSSEKIVIHYENSEEKTLTPGTLIFEEILNKSMKNVVINKKMSFDLNLEEVMVKKNTTYIITIFPETMNVSYDTTQNIEVDGVIIICSGEHKNLIIIGKRGIVKQKGEKDIWSVNFDGSEVYSSKADTNVLCDLIKRIR